MKKFKKLITSPVATVVLFALAAGLLLFSTIGGARAAFLAYSDTYAGHIEMYDIGVSLLEKSEHDSMARQVAFRNYIQDSEDKWDEVEGGMGVLLHNLLERDQEGNLKEELVLGRTYSEEISVANTGTINEYVRVTIYKYWIDADGNKVIPYEAGRKRKSLPAGMTMASGADEMSTYGLSPSLIDLHYINVDAGNGKGDWILDTENSAETEERTVFYYNKLLKSGEDTTRTPLTDTLTIDSSIGDRISSRVVKESDDGHRKTIRTTYDYDGWQFCVEAHVDAVQEHNAVDAIKSAWGRDVSFRKNGTMKLE